VKAFRFEGNTLLTHDELSEALLTLVAEPVDIAEPQNSAVLVSDLYRDKGWVVQARLPSQDISDGKVTIQITEAVVGKVQIVGHQAMRVKAEPVFNLNTSLAFEKKDYFNVSGGTTSSAYSNTLISLGLSGNSFDALGAGANAHAWVMSWGQLNLDGSPTQMSDASTSQTAGDYSKVRYSLSRQQQLDANVFLYAALGGQWANKNLDSSEKFYLGGVSGVRAYPSSEGGGSLGQLLNLELRWRLPGNVNLVGFYDFGRVVVNAKNDFSGAPALNEYALQGTGLELSWRSTSGVALQAIYARRVGENPNAIATDLNRGADQDGTFYRDRLWLIATLTY
jgi:hypothetical protein